MRDPRYEQSFLKDKRTARKMCVGGMDKKASGVRQRRIERECRIQERQQNEKRRKLEHKQVLALGDL